MEEKRTMDLTLNFVLFFFLFDKSVDPISTNLRTQVDLWERAKKINHDSVPTAVTKPQISFVFPGTQFCGLRISQTSFFVPGIENDLAHCCHVAPRNL